ncbi:polyketide cyclase [Pedobacter yulinensis]|uniref:Polyketide cyclase n=1 Tax=Pedobacter yulinensis TaxID=2126353 RepID=A0A2T3HIN3_9SPHI|nr:SRPBCC family protein [Pedobacter yulinensis]PST82290.1 polyketide cyclase [Pedobacter yulinensis]
MKALKIIVGIIIVLAIIFFVGGLFLPATYSLSRSTEINAPDSVIYRNISDFNEFRQWNPWAKMEPTAKVTVTGTPAQPGHIYAWQGDKTGSGEMKITETVPNKMTDIDLRFIKPFESSSDTRFDLSPAGKATRVTWTMSGENRGTFDKWMSLMMDGMVGKDFENGLKSLKEKSEAVKM